MQSDSPELHFAQTLQSLRQLQGEPRAADDGPREQSTDIYALFANCSDDQIVNLCSVLDSLGHRDQIAICFDTLMRMYPAKQLGFLQLHYQVKYNFSDFAECKRIKLQMLELKTADQAPPRELEGIYFDLVHICYKLSQFDAALLFLEKTSQNDEHVVEMQVKLLREIQQHDRALEILVEHSLSAQATGNTSHYFRFMLLQGDILIADMKEHQKAAAILGSMAVDTNQLEFNTIWFQILLAHAQSQSGATKVEDKGLHFNKLIATANISAQEKSRLLLSLGHLYFENVLPNQALEAYLNSIKACETNSAKFKIVELLQNLGMWQLSFNFLQQVQQYYYKTYFYLGQQMMHFGKFKDAVTLFDKALVLNQQFREALFQKSQCLINIQRFSEAQQILEGLLHQNFSNSRVQMALILLKQVLGNFNDYQVDTRFVITAVDRYIHQFFLQQDKLNPYNPFHRSPIPQKSTFIHKISHSQSVALGVINTNLNLKKLRFLQSKLTCEFPVFTFQHFDDANKQNANQPLKVGFLLPQTSDSPLIHIIFGWFQLFDAAAMRPFIYSTDDSPANAVREQLAQMSAKFTDLSGKDPIQSAKIIYEDQIQVLINFNMPGVTVECQICAMKPAPVQILSFQSPGTSGASYYDYIWSDSYTIAKELFCFYTEQIAVTELPVVYSLFANNVDKIILDAELDAEYADPTRRVSFCLSNALEPVTIISSDAEAASLTGYKTMPIGRSATKDILQIPSDAFVISCLSNIYKLEPELLGCLARLLKDRADAVLLLLGYPTEAQQHLLNFFMSRGVEQNRIFFVTAFHPLEQARYMLAVDVYVDSAKMCGQDSVLAALLACVPIVSLSQMHICQRQAGSYLNTIGATELQCASYEQIVQTTRLLMNNRDFYLSMRAKLRRNRARIFDVEEYVRQLTGVIQATWRQWALQEKTQRPFLSPQKIFEDTVNGKKTDRE